MRGYSHNIVSFVSKLLNCWLVLYIKLQSLYKTAANQETSARGDFTWHFPAVFVATKPYVFNINRGMFVVTKPGILYIKLCLV